MKNVKKNLIEAISILILSLSIADSTFAASISKEQAQVVAENFLRSKTGSTSSKAILHYQQAEQDGSVDFYVFNFLSPKGFVIVTGDDRVKPVIAYSTKSNFDISMAQQSGVSFWMNKMQKQIQKVKQDNIQPREGISQLWNAYLSGAPIMNPRSSSVGPLLNTTWDQSGFYNTLCPSNGSGGECPTGCVATAMAQIMKYWNYPPSGTGSHSYTDSHGSITGSHSVNLGTTTYDWSNMPDAGPTSATNDIATLMYHCGVSVEMDYESDISGACVFEGLLCDIFTNYSGHTARDAFEDQFGYETPNGQARSIFLGNWADMLKEELDLNRPILYTGYGSSGAHAWVIDGYDNDDFFHMNWGWGGANNDYYDIDNFHPDGVDFDNFEGALIEIRPPGCIPFYEGEIPTLLGLPLPIIASNYIYFTGGTIESGFVTYNAGNKIVLEPGCSVLEGTFADFYIEGCTGEPIQGDDEIEVRSTSRIPNNVVERIDESLIIAPNPFSYSTNLHYILSDKHEVSIAIHNSAGTLVTTLFEKQSQDAGEYDYTFEAFDLTAGFYIVVLQKDCERIAKRMVLTK